MLTSTLPDAGAERLPDAGRGRDRRPRRCASTGFDGPGFDGGRVQVRLLAEPEAGGLSGASIEVIAILARGADRRLRLRDHGLALAAGPDPAPARRRARSWPPATSAIEVPTEGNDEFAALGTEFNLMARQLEKRLEELQLERKRLREAIRRVGQSFAKGLERDARARDRGPDRGRRRRRRRRPRGACAPAPHGRFEEVAGEGDVEPLPRRDPRRRGGRARRRGRRWRPSSTAHFALSHPLRAQEGGRILGMLTVARARDGVLRPPSGSCSPTSPSRPASRSRTSTCTTRSSARRSPTS